MKYKNVSGMIIGMLIFIIVSPGIILLSVFEKGNAYAITLAVLLGMFAILGLVLTIKELVRSYIINEKEVEIRVFGIVVRQISKNQINGVVLVKTKKTDSLWCTVHILPCGINEDIVSRAKTKVTPFGKNTFLSRQKGVISIHLTINAFMLLEKYGYYVTTTI